MTSRTRTLRPIPALALVFALTLAFAAAAFAQPPQGPMAPRSEPPADKAKHTALGKYATSMEAYMMYRMGGDKKPAFLDVRTPEEYDLVGHTPFAVNIPVKLWTGNWQPETQSFALADNSNFVERVKKRFKPDDRILVFCRSGGRSAVAVNQLAAAGFTDVWNIVDGFEGDMVMDPESSYQGKRMKNGWKNTGLPWGYKNDPDLVYVK